jgi:hypothetical protein
VLGERAEQLARLLVQRHRGGAIARVGGGDAGREALGKLVRGDGEQPAAEQWQHPAALELGRKQIEVTAGGEPAQTRRGGFARGARPGEQEDELELGGAVARLEPAQRGYEKVRSFLGVCAGKSRSVTSPSVWPAVTSVSRP